MLGIQSNCLCPAQQRGVLEVCPCENRAPHHHGLAVVQGGGVCATRFLQGFLGEAGGQSG